MVNTDNPMRLTADLSLLKTDMQQLRLHLRWLLTDAQEQREQVDGRTAVYAELHAELTMYLPRLAELDALLTQFESATERR